MLFGSRSVYSDETKSVQPYIDQLKQGMPKESGAVEPSANETDPYIQSIKNRLKEKETGTPSSESYIDQLRRTDPATRPRGEKDQTYTEELKSKLPQKDTDGAIKALKEGKSDLHANYEGEIHNAFGLRVGVSYVRNYKALNGTQAADFSSIYNNSSWIPNLGIFFEYQPFHSEWFGNLGLASSLDVVVHRGFGTFSGTVPRGQQIEHPEAAGGPIPGQSQTKVQLYTIPLFVGLNYRFNLFRYLRPYVQAGPTAVLFIESRSDKVSGNRNISNGLLLSAGVNILLDWIDKSSTWSLYETGGVKHFYLTVDYSRLSTIGGDVRMTASGLALGLTYEF